MFERKNCKCSVKHLITYKEFKNSNSETSNYETPKSAVKPQPADKIYAYVKNKVDNAPLWGLDMKSQEKDNAIKADRHVESIEVCWIGALNESENIDVVLTHHGKERSKTRYNTSVDIKKNEIENLIDKSSEMLIKNASNFKTFVIHGIKSHLNVVGALLKKAGKWVFEVITVMIKDTFYPKTNDKYIEVFEFNSNNDQFLIYGSI